MRRVITVSLAFTCFVVVGCAKEDYEIWDVNDDEIIEEDEWGLGLTYQ